MFEEIKELIANQLKISKDELTPETNLRTDCGVNSIEIAEIVLDIEDKYGIEIDDKAISKKTTLGEIAEYVQKELG